MQEFHSITRFEIEKGLEKPALTVSRIISLAMVGGPLIFVFMILAIANSRQGAASAGNGIMDVFVTAIVVIGVAGYATYLLLPGIMLKKERLQKRFSKPFVNESGKAVEDPVARLIMFDRTFMIIRLAILEGVSLLCVVALFMVSTNGLLQAEPAYWLLLAPLAIQAYVTFTNYFSKDQYIDRIEKHILAPLKQAAH